MLCLSTTVFQSKRLPARLLGAHEAPIDTDNRFLLVNRQAWVELHGVLDPMMTLIPDLRVVEQARLGIHRLG